MATDSLFFHRQPILLASSKCTGPVQRQALVNMARTDRRCWPPRPLHLLVAPALRTRRAHCAARAVLRLGRRRPRHLRWRQCYHRDDICSARVRPRLVGYSAAYSTAAQGEAATIATTPTATTTTTTMLKRTIVT